MASVIIDEKLIELGLDAPTREAAICIVADKLYALDYVNPGTTSRRASGSMSS
jgi:hypothetical protein